MFSGKYIYVASTLDTKNEEVAFIKSLIISKGSGLRVKTIDLSTSTQQNYSTADISNIEVASFHPEGKEAIFCGDRGIAITNMGIAFKRMIQSCTDVGGIIGLGGSGGSAIIAPALQRLPIGVPKLLVSTMASGDVAHYIGESDISIMYSVTDLAGLNRISREVLTNAACQIAGAVYFKSQEKPSAIEEKNAIGLTMFGVTTPCINAITAELSFQLDCLVFHATGAGGRSMEKLIDSHLLSANLDITTTEVCDFLFGGVLACNEDRFGAIVRTKIPTIMSCGALDMINFGHKSTVPEHYKNRLFYEHNQEVTLMRTTIQENRELGEWIGHKLNLCEGDIRFLIPLKGFSALDHAGQAFYDPDADLAFIEALEKTVQQTSHRKIIKLPYHINDAEFSQAVVTEFRAIAPQLF